MIRQISLLCFFERRKGADMEEEVLNQFEYYYGVEAEAFNYIQVPRFLFTDPKFQILKPESKILYSLMLDRMKLSRKNGWLDDKNRVYIIYRIEEMMEDASCKHTKCFEILKELISFGLIEKNRQGLGRPDIIYVKDFLHAVKEPANADKYTVVRNTDIKTSADSDVRNTEIKSSAERIFRDTDNGEQDIRETEPSNTNINNNNINQNDNSYPLLPQIPEGNVRGRSEEEEKIKKQIGYDTLRRRHQGNLDLLAYLLQQMTEMMLEAGDKVEISMNRYEDAAFVKDRLRQITYDDVEGLLQLLPDKGECNIKNPQGYMRRCLINLVERRGAICTTEQIKGNKTGTEYNFKAMGQ